MNKNKCDNSQRTEVDSSFFDVLLNTSKVEEFKKKKKKKLEEEKTLSFFEPSEKNDLIFVQFDIIQLVLRLLNFFIQ